MTLHPGVRDLGRAVLVAIVYLAAAKGGLALAYENSSVTAVWAPTGIALAALVLGGRRLWPGIAAGAVLANSWTGLDAPTVAAIATGNTLEALAGATLLRALRFQPALERLRDVLALVLAGALCTLVSATIGLLSLAHGGYLVAAEADFVWRTWWLGDLGGALLVAPLILVLATAGRPRAIAARRLVEAAALATVTIAVSATVFSGSVPLEYLLLPLQICAALRFRQAGATIASAGIAAIAVGCTVAGRGPFADASPDASLMLSQSFIGVGAVVGLVLAAVTSERARARRGLVDARDDLERQVQERTAALARTQDRLVEAQELARIGSWEWDVQADTVTWSDVLYGIYDVDRETHEATFGGYLERVHPEDRERVTATIQGALAERCSFAFDERIVRPDGTIRVLASRGQVFADDDGRPVRMVGICQDVTESRRAERALRDSEARARLIVDAASDAFVATDARDVIIEFNAQAEALFGWTRAEALGHELAGLLIPERHRDRHRASIAGYLATADAPWLHQRLERDALHRDGHEFLVELTISPVQTQDGITFNTFMHDVTERRRRERYLATEHAVSRVLLESPALEEARPRLLEAFGTGLDWAVGAWWGVDRERAVLRCEEFWSAADAPAAFEEATLALRLAPGSGLPGRVWAGGEMHIIDVIGEDANFPRAQPAADAGLTAAVAVPLRSHGEVVAVIEFFATGGLHLLDELGDMMQRLGERVAQYIERRDAEDHLREAEERFHRAFEDAGTGMALIGVGGAEEDRFLEVNDALCASTRYSRDELLSMRIGAMTHPEDAVETLQLVRRLVDGELDSVQGETRLLDAMGEVVWIAFSTSVIRDGDGRALYRLAQMQDITERKRFEGQLQHLADHDPVTALFNRRRFEEELGRELAAAQRYGTSGAVLALDLDNFKYVNDTLGHSAGDELIAGVAEILSARLRRTDIIARLGGDEFAVVLPQVDEREALRVASELLAAIRREAVVTTSKGSRRATASIGVALFPDDAGQLSGEELLIEADIAMYDAKEAGRDQACVYDARSSRQQSLEARMTWSEQIREAFLDDRFTLYAQPIVPLQGPASDRYELLVRMVDRDGDIIPPGAFLPVAERFDLVQEIDRWVVREAIELLAAHERRGHDVIFEVNLSAKSLGQTDLLDDIGRLLAATGVDPSRLVFEVTETAAIINVDRAKQFARRLHELGCRFALDDFGAGFASFYYLKHLPFDYLKIDGEFVESLSESATNQLVVQAVVAIARGLGKQTIAEYVGDDATIALLRGYGVDHAQGFHVGRPLPAVEIAGATRRAVS
ncbi:MAG TPA: EAL domain-containing protein [Solirubrobacteraceae bacterium]|nr:EAL domain-containing protein [Solirubrobacteraceae bacterium]